MGILIEVLFTFINFLTANPTSIEFEKIEREYYLFKPKYNVEPSPLVVNLHGYGSNALQQRIYTQFNKFALPKNIYVVYPEGVNRSWNAGIDPNNMINDVGFINALLDTIIANNNIDISRIYVCGFSNGGMMTNKLALELNDRFAAFGNVAGNLILEEGQSIDFDRKIPMIHIHGTDDSWVPYQRKASRNRMDVDESLEFWKNHNKLDQFSKEVISTKSFFKKTSLNKIVFFNDNDREKVVHYQVVGGGHQWFGSAYGSNILMKSYVGRNNTDFHASEELINFFLNYKLDNNE